MKIFRIFLNTLLRGAGFFPAHTEKSLFFYTFPYSSIFSYQILSTRANLTTSGPLYNPCRRINCGPEARCACGKEVPRASSLCVRAPCTDTPRTLLRGLDIEGYFRFWNGMPVRGTLYVV